LAELFATPEIPAVHPARKTTVLIDEQDQVVYQKRLPNDLPLMAQQLSGYQDVLQGIVVVDLQLVLAGRRLMDQGHRVHLANTAAIQQYEGLKYTDDHSDARWLAHILRLGVLPGLHLSERGASGARSAAQARPDGPSKNHQSVKHTESDHG
jgi:transposase